MNKSKANNDLRLNLYKGLRYVLLYFRTCLQHRNSSPHDIVLTSNIFFGYTYHFEPKKVSISCYLHDFVITMLLKTEFDSILFFFFKSDWKFKINVFFECQGTFAILQIRVQIQSFCCLIQRFSTQLIPRPVLFTRIYNFCQVIKKIISTVH